MTSIFVSPFFNLFLDTLLAMLFSLKSKYLRYLLDFKV